MNAITTTGSNALTPTSMESAIKLAEMMARGKLVPTHLHNSPGDCLMIVEQALRWQMSPFAVAQCTSVIQGRLMFEGKLVSAALNSSGILSSRLDYEFSGADAQRAVTVRGTLKGETKPREVTVFLADAKTSNGMWVKQPDQQLVYAATRVWARRHAPEVMLGVYAPEEFDRAEPFAGPTLDHEAEAPDGARVMASLKAAAAPTPRAARKVAEEPPRPRTRKDYLDGLEIALRDARSPEEVDRIVCGEEVMRAKETFQNGHKQRLETLISETLAKWWHTPPDAETPDDGELEIVGADKLAAG